MVGAGALVVDQEVAGKGHAGDIGPYGPECKTSHASG
jgi:hypothetical protein